MEKLKQTDGSIIGLTGKTEKWILSYIIKPSLVG